MKIFITAFLMFSISLMAELEVHEWGSINIVTGQQKVTVGNIADDQSDLPNFVEVWTKQPQIRPIMIEKPIIYFYTDTKQTVSVNVKYPEGVFTQWWPKPNSFFPYAPTGNNPTPTTGGLLNWTVTLDPKGSFDKQMPAMNNHIWWPIARDVDAATVLSNRGGVEKFLFYRGAGKFIPTLKVDISDKGEFLLSNVDKAESREIYTVNVEEGKDPHIVYLPALTADKTILNSADEAAKHMQSRLEEKGLFTKEAAGMVKIWRKAMFEKPGQRAMYMMEKEDIDKMLPLQISPKPDKEVRVILIRFECLSSNSKSNIEKWIQQLAAKSYKDRKEAQKKLMETGRLGEAVMRTAYQNAKDPEVRMSLKEILEKITPKNPNP